MENRANLHDFVVLGGGIVGLSTAMALGQRFPAAKIVLIEKESSWGAHQTGHNSGVILSGIVTADDLIPADSGVRAQAVLPDGRLVDDFLLVQARAAIHVCNAPSPAATSSIEIGRAIVDALPEQPHLKIAR